MDNKIIKNLTPIEWFAEITSKLGYVSTDILEQAKEKEQEQITNISIDFINWVDTTSYTRQDYGDEWESCLDSSGKTITTKELFELYKTIKHEKYQNS
jgi:hypothetical protein